MIRKGNSGCGSGGGVDSNYPNITDKLVTRHYYSQKRKAFQSRRFRLKKRPHFDRNLNFTRRGVGDLPSVDLDGNIFPEPRERVVLNIGGVRFHSFRSTLSQVPGTRLFYLMQMPADRLHPDEYEHSSRQYFFDRSPELFEHVINYYRTGQLHVPRDVCWPLFDSELQFWGLDHSHLETCCWMIYRQHTDNENTLKTLDAEDEEDHRDPRLDELNSEEGEGEGKKGGGAYRKKWRRAMVELWAVMDDPISSNLAKGVALFSLFTILISVAIFCLETHHSFRKTTYHNTSLFDPERNETVWRVVEEREPIEVIFYMETCCVIWFALEFLLRFLSCPNKCTYMKKWLNIVDFLSILPYFFDFLKTSNQATGLLRVVRVCRVFRVFKLTRHSVGLKILWHTLHASMKELFILGIFMFLGVVIFASLIYYAERLFDTEESRESDFVDIPGGFWWAIVTMTTLGYGDMVPHTLAGQMIGSLCALSGLLTIALPVPVIVSNFSLYYSHYQAKIKLPKQTIDQLNNKISAHSPNGEDPPDEVLVAENLRLDGGKASSPGLKGMTRPFRQKTIKNLMNHASSQSHGGTELKLAIGSKHVGYIDPPFNEKRERERVKNLSVPNQSLCTFSSSPHLHVIKPPATSSINAKTSKDSKDNGRSISSEHQRGAMQSGDADDSFGTDVFDDSLGGSNYNHPLLKVHAMQQQQIGESVSDNQKNNNNNNNNNRRQLEGGREKQNNNRGRGDATGTSLEQQPQKGLKSHSQSDDHGSDSTLTTANEVSNTIPPSHNELALDCQSTKESAA